MTSNDFLGRRRRACGNTGQRQRRCHQSEELPAVGGCEQSIGLAWIFVMEVFGEGCRICQLFQAAPEARSVLARKTRANCAQIE